MLTEKLADFIVETDYTNIPHAAIDIAKKAILDCVGCAVGGSREPAAQIGHQLARQIAGTQEAGVIGHGFRTSAEMAAWLNGIASHSLDFDDILATGDYNFHPSIPIVPAILALAEKTLSSGQDVLIAYIIGFATQY